MEDQLLDEVFRKQIIQEIKSTENIRRMSVSERETNIYRGNIRPYVKKQIEAITDDIDEFPIVASINIAKKLVDQKASLYREEPIRQWSDLNDDQYDKVSSIYEDMMIDFKMIKSNRLFELQRQTHVAILPKKGELICRPIKNHQINVIVDPENPEEALGYVLSSFDKSRSTLRSQTSDGYNQRIADQDDYKTEHHVWWSPSYHFTTNGLGEYTSDDNMNPIAPIVPIVEISDDKDLEYWIQSGACETNFTTEYNCELSKLSQINLMQGFAQAYLKAPSELQPKQLKVGPTQVLRLITSAGVDSNSIEFGYATTGADMSGAMAFVESLLAQFLSSQGVEPSIISGSAQSSTKYNSGIERLLALIEKFEASKETMALYKRSEQRLWEVIKSWINLGQRSNLLSQKYVIGLIPEKSELSIEYKRPESALSEMEKLEVWKAKREEGLSSRQDWFIDYEGMDVESANERIGEIDGNELGGKIYTNQRGYQSEIEPERADGITDQGQPLN